MSSLNDIKPLSKESPQKGVSEDRERSPWSPDISKDGSEQGEIQEELPVGAKRQHSPSVEEQPLPKRSKPAPDLGLFRNMVGRMERVPCVISVNENEPIGRLYSANRGFRTLLMITPGPGCAPTISIGFRLTSRPRESDQANCEWDTVSNSKGEWAMSDFRHGYASPDAANPRMAEPKVVNQCRNQHMSQLLYVRFNSWSQAAGYSHKGAFVKEEKSIKTWVNAIVQPRKSYSLEIWFLPPLNASEFRRDCLRYFDDALNRRNNPHHFWTDPEGVCFTDTIWSQPSARRMGRDGRMMFRPSRIGHAGMTRDSATQWEDPSGQAEQSTAECPLAAQHEEHGIQPVA